MTTLVEAQPAGVQVVAVQDRILSDDNTRWPVRRFLEPIDAPSYDGGMERSEISRRIDPRG